MLYAARIQLSTTISDAVLALVTILAALPVLVRTDPTRRFGAVCLLFIGLTAGVGAFRFAGFEVGLFHSSMAWTSRLIALPALGPVFVALSMGRAVIKPYWYALSLGLGGLGWALPVAWGLLPGVVAMLLILGVAARHVGAAPRVAAGLVFGVAAVSGAGLVIGTEGTWAGLPRVDLFHYALAVGHVAFAYGLAALTRRVPPADPRQ